MIKKQGNENPETKALTWRETMKIPPMVWEEVITFDGLGWAIDKYNQPMALTDPEKKVLCLFIVKSGLSLVGKQAMFLGNSVYVSKTGKIAVAKKDKKMPLARIDVRAATEAERSGYGIAEQENPTKATYEHLWYAQIFAWTGPPDCESKDKTVQPVAEAFGHAFLGNIKLKGKENDPVRLCADMAQTRAVSRALTYAYDFFGAESLEEVWDRPAQEREVIDTTAEVIEDTPVGTPVDEDVTTVAGF